MEKIEITAGVYYLVIEKAQLSLLCGCPADSVKHLMKKGLILTKEKGGVVYETGPNAILLSDILIQNGNFANLAEFPVLQMLYKQGMIIPNHPNNTGTKPLIIGSEEQVKSQMQYIYRGNYGLVSEEEIIVAGTPDPIAHEMMRMKLKFAFGKIAKSEELIDSIIVEKNKAYELRNGVYIKRLKLNVFEFEYNQEKLVVDLNLKDNETYETPYDLQYHSIKRDYFAIVHSGEGDGWDFTRPCSASIIMFQGKIYLIDAGPNIHQSLTALGIDTHEIEGIFHTHAHDDHFAGLTTLIQADHRIKYYSTSLVRASVMKKLCALMSMEEAHFGRYFDVQDLEFGKWNNIDGLEVKPMFSPHPIETSIFLFRTLWQSGYQTYAHFVDIAAFNILRGMITDKPQDIGITRAFFEKIKKDYLTPAHLKKIDIGGGLIHGDAKDFKDDISEKILLSHTALKLDDKQKEIGSDAQFGMVDILIATHQDYAMRNAFHYLRSYFPDAPEYDLKILLNCEVVSFYPGTILYKKGTASRYVYLILTGSVELIHSDTEVHRKLASGSLLGELSGLIEFPNFETYRATSFVKELRISSKLYLEFVKRNQLYHSIESVQDSRLFLQSTWIFGEMVSYPIQNRIAQSIRLKVYEDDTAGTYDSNELRILQSGEVFIYSGNTLIEKLGPGDFWGEESVLFQIPPMFNAKSRGLSSVYHVPGEVLQDIPMVQWKLWDRVKRRLKVVGEIILNESPD